MSVIYVFCYDCGKTTPHSLDGKCVSPEHDVADRDKILEATRYGRGSKPPVSTKKPPHVPDEDTCETWEPLFMMFVFLIGVAVGGFIWG